MARVTPRGYVPKSEHDVADILAVEAELLKSEGVDPEWPGFEDKPEPTPGDDE